MNRLKLIVRLLMIMIPVTWLSTARADKPVNGNTTAEEFRKVLVKRHQAMSVLHSKLAQCLESGKKYEQCHAEAIESCKKELGADCQDWGHHHRRADSEWHERGCFWMAPVNDESIRGIKK